MSRFSPLIRVFGALLMGFSLCLAVPMALSWYVQDGAHLAFDEAFALALVTGSALYLSARKEKRELKVRDGFLLVVLVWTVLPLFACLPFIVQLDISATDAYFEAVSGLTATGATVMSGLDTMPLSINFWRTFLHWIGGMGVVVLAVAILPLLGIGGRQMFKAETPGPMKETSLTPRIAETAKGLWRVYLLLTVCCGLALWHFGMEPWDAMMHAFSVMGLGGFSSKDASLGHFDSLEIELTVMFFALLSGINYATHFLALRGRSLNPYRQDPEVPYFLGALAVSILALALYLLVLGCFRQFRRVPALCRLPFDLAGDLARFCDHRLRAVAVLRPAVDAVPRQFHRLLRIDRRRHQDDPRHDPLQAGVSRTDSRHASRASSGRCGSMAPWCRSTCCSGVMAFGFIYMVSIVSLTLLMSFTGLDIVTAFSAVVATINNTGPGLNLVGPMSNYSVLTDFQTWICTFAMMLGRLEIFTLLVVLTPAFWRK